MTATRTERFHSWLATPIGPLGLVGDGAALLQVRLPERGAPAALADAGRRDDAALAEARAQLEAWFAGERQDFELELAAVGSPFQQRVWAALRTIPYGRTTSYGAIAAQLGRPTASRAVGAANGRNPLPIIVPCHRVIGADGALTGFGGGLACKRWLLEHEGALPPERPQRVSRTQATLFG